MHIELHDSLRDSAAGQRGQALIGACVHCGFCLEACPTYLDTRDERDSPRGRIYFIGQLLESGSAGPVTRRHLDRCLTCRACEPACPSGMRYGELLELGRNLVEQAAPRRAPVRHARRLLRAVLARPAIFAALLRAGQLLRPLLPRALRSQVPRRQHPGRTPAARHTRRMLLLEGCVQRAATPRTNAAARRVLDRLGVSLHSVPAAGCCGALHQHLAAHDDALRAVRGNIDAWWPQVEAGAEAIVSSASGCGVMLADYGRLLADDPQYAERARRISALARDLSEVIEALPVEELGIAAGPRVAVHTPCTLQHGLRRPGSVGRILRRAGYALAPTRDDALCCGSAGTYSLLQAATAGRLRARKLAALGGADPDLIATANVGCQLHLQQASPAPVLHWIELLDRA